MTVTILTGAVDDIAPGSDAAVIDKVKSGAFQMAVIPARAWSGAGVTSLKALQAPFPVRVRRARRRGRRRRRHREGFVRWV